jgi:hypothetical protein
VCRAGSGVNTIIVLSKMEGFFGVSTPSCPWVVKWLRGRGEANTFLNQMSAQTAQRFIDGPKSRPLSQFIPVSQRTPDCYHRPDTTVNCIRLFKWVGVYNPTFEVGCPRPYRSNDGATNRFPRLSKFSPSNLILFWIRISSVQCFTFRVLNTPFWVEMSSDFGTPSFRKCGY